MKTQLVACSLLLIPALAFGGDDFEIGKYSKVYSGPEGLQVTFVPFKSKDGALIKVSGVETEIDGVVMRYEKVKSGRDGATYRTTLHGEGFGTFHDRAARWGGGRDYKVYLPEAVMKGINVSYDEKASKAVNSDNILSEYRKSKNQASISKLGAWNRKEREARHNTSFKEAGVEFKKSCGYALSATIEWKSVSDDHLKKYSIYSFCSEPVSRLARHCAAKPENKAAVKKGVKSYQCSFAKKLKIKLDAGKLSFKVDPEAANQSDFVKAYFQNEL